MDSAGRLRDLHVLPRVSDSWSFLYVEHARVDQHDRSIALRDASGTVPIPCASLNLLMLGPGTTITHEAVKTCTSHGCTIVWTGEEGVRLYASGTGETRRASRLYRQARLWASERSRLTVVRRMYERRFAEPVPTDFTLQQVRGLEGIRVRETYAQVSRETGVPWHGRSYKVGTHQASDSINRALSTANSCLYGVCHAAIVAAGYSPALGFIHTGKLLAFVFDIADMYKTEVSIPAAFMAVAGGPEDLDAKVRMYCRNLFAQTKILARIVRDIDDLLDTGPLQLDLDFEEAGGPAALWDPQSGLVEGGVNYAPQDTGELGNEYVGAVGETPTQGSGRRTDGRHARRARKRN